jgi:hypothetical protein
LQWQPVVVVAVVVAITAMVAAIKATQATLAQPMGAMVPVWEEQMVVEAVVEAEARTAALEVLLTQAMIMAAMPGKMAFV